MSAWLRMTISVALAGLLAIHVEPARAQEQEPAPAEDAQTDPAPQDEAPDESDPLGDLDDLLDIPEEDRDTPRGDAGVLEELDTDRLELERRLSQEELSQQFQQAVAQMGETADRIARAGDLGVRTQRIQDEIIRKLDVLIEEAQDQQGSSSSQSQQQSQQQQQQQAPSQPQQSSPSPEGGQGENQGETMPPPGQQAQLQRQLDLALARWGALPERIRDALIQGMQERPSSLYRELTEEYYRRLAEDEDE